MLWHLAHLTCYSKLHFQVELAFDEKDLEYYEKLVSQIGPAAKYQLFADMLPGKTISGLEIKVPAVKTKMGPYNCYTFPISPEYLLKISYVSHRTKGKASDINTYQRMIGKSRLKAIRQYISEKGTLDRTTTLIKGWLSILRDGASDWWDLGSAEGGGFAMNDSVTACINVLKSVLLHLEQNGRNLHQLTAIELVEAVQPYAQELGKYFGGLGADERKRYRDLRGSQGQTARTRRCQQAIREKFSKFNPPGLDEFITGEKEQINLKAKQVIDRIEVLLKRLVLDELKQEFSTDTNSWWQEGVPKVIHMNGVHEKLLRILSVVATGVGHCGR